MSLNAESRLRANALKLRFADLWQAVANELGKPTTARPRAALESLARLGEDVTLRVLGFLDARSLGRVSMTCSALERFCAPIADAHRLLWAPLCAAQMRALCHDWRRLRGPLKRRYLQLLLWHEEAELRHYSAQSRLLLALSQMPKGAVVNVVSNIGHFDSAAVALAISKRREIAMSTVVLSRTQDAITFRRSTHFVGPLSFYSQDNVSSLLLNNASLDRPPIFAPGFIGYAIDLLRLDPNDEYMRYTFLLCAYKNLSLWQTSADVLAARRSGELPAHVLATTLDQYFDPAADDLALWLQTGKLPGGLELQHFVAFGGRKRPRLAANAQSLFQHIFDLQVRRDNLHLALAHLDDDDDDPADAAAASTPTSPPPP